MVNSFLVLKIFVNIGSFFLVLVVMRKYSVENDRKSCFLTHLKPLFDFYILWKGSMEMEHCVKGLHDNCAISFDNFAAFSSHANFC